MPESLAPQLPYPKEKRGPRSIKRFFGLQRGLTHKKGEAGSCSQCDQ